MRTDRDDEEYLSGGARESPRRERTMSPTSPRHQRHWQINKPNNGDTSIIDSAAAASSSSNTGRTSPILSPGAGGSGGARPGGGALRSNSPSSSPRLDRSAEKISLTSNPTRLRGPGTATIGTARSMALAGQRGRESADFEAVLLSSTEGGTNSDVDNDDTDEDLDANVELVNVVSNNAKQHSGGHSRSHSSGKSQTRPKKPEPISPGRRRAPSVVTLRRQRKEQPQRDPDEAVFRFWMLVEDFKRQNDRPTRAYLADILYTQYLVPSTAESSTSPYFVSALRMPTDILASLEKGIVPSSNGSVSRSLFDAAQNEVWKHLRKRPFPSFVKQIFNAALFCSSFDPLFSALRDAGDASERRKHQLGSGGGARTQVPLRIPDVLFSGLERFLTNRKWKIDDEALDDWVTSDERVTISTTTIPDVSTLCYRGHGTLNMTPHKALDMISSVDERCYWDHMYSTGRVEQVLGEPTASLLRVETWVPGEKNGNKYEQLVLRTARRLEDGSAIYLWRSVEHPDFPEKPNVQRLECHLAGFFIQPHSNPKKSTIDSISMLDSRGLLSPETTRTMNLLQARLLTSLNRYIAAVEKRSASLVQTKLMPPVLLPACYDCNCAWNTWPESDKEKDVPRLSFNEGDNVVLLEQGTDPSCWTGFSFDSGQRGLIDIDYFRYVPPDTSGKEEASTDFMPLIELLSRSDLMIITALSSTADSHVAERVVNAFLHVLRMFPGRTIPLLVGLIGSEVRKTGIIQGSTLFRGNDIASHLLSAYCHSVGRNFLLEVIRPLVEQVLALYAQNKSMEIDPTRAAPGEDIEENVQTLSDFCQLFLDTVTSSIKRYPMSLRAVCYHLQREVIKKFPESKSIVLSNFFFLRFISPAIVSPHAFGILEEQVPPKCTRGLVLVSKVLQSLANGVEFGEKEDHMLRLNGFIRSNLAKVEAFFEEIASEASTEEEVLERELTLEEAYPSAAYLHAALCSNLHRVAVKMSTVERSKKTAVINNNNSISGGEGPVFQQLVQVLLDCGPTTLDVNAEDAQDVMQAHPHSNGSSRGKNKLSLRKKARSTRSRGSKELEEGLKPREKEKSGKEKKQERIANEKREIERTRPERAREKLVMGRDRGTTYHGSFSGEMLAPVDHRDLFISDGALNVPPSPGRGRSRSRESASPSAEAFEEARNVDHVEALEKDRGESSGGREKSTFLKISMIKKSGIIERLNKKRNAKKQDKAASAASSASSSPTNSATTAAVSSGEQSKVESDEEEDCASTSSERVSSDDEEDSYASDTDMSISSNDNSSSSGGKTSSASKRSGSRGGSNTARDSPTQRRNGATALGKTTTRMSSSKDGGRTDKKSPSASTTPTPKRRGSNSTPLLQVISSCEVGTEPAVLMAGLSKQLEAQHEERVKAFKELERFFISQSKPSVSSSSSSTTTTTSSSSSPSSPSCSSLSCSSLSSSSSASDSPRGQQLLGLLSPRVATPQASPYTIEEFRKLMAAYEDKVRQEERLIQAVVYLSSTGAPPSPTSSVSPSSSPSSSSQGLASVAAADEDAEASLSPNNTNNTNNTGKHRPAHTSSMLRHQQPTNTNTQLV